MKRILTPLLAVAAALLVGTVFILIAGKNPALAYQALWQASFGSLYGFGEFLVSSTPLIFMGLAVAFAFRAGLFNIGGEGQYLAAQFTAVVVAYRLSDVVPPGLGTVLALGTGMLAGAVVGAIAGGLRAWRGAHEVITTIMLNYVVLYLSNWLVLGPFRAPGDAAATHRISEDLMLSPLLPVSRLHAGFLLALAAAVAVQWILRHTTLGYNIRAVGHNPAAAENAGIHTGRHILTAMALSGALAGLAGAVQGLGVAGRFYQVMSFPGYGFNGIAVALLARNHPLGVVLAALLFGWLDRGAPAMQALAGIPKSVVLVVQAAIIFFVAAPALVSWVLSVRHREVPQP